MILTWLKLATVRRSCGYCSVGTGFSRYTGTGIFNTTTVRYEKCALKSRKRENIDLYCVFLLTTVL